MKLLFFGAGAFGIPALRALAASGRRPFLVVSQPDQPAGRHKKLTPPPLALVARELDLPLFQPEKLHSAESLAHLQTFGADVAIVVSFGRILKPVLLALPRLGCINIHGSLLPRHRGASPIRGAILAGDRETGVTLIQMDAGLDTGALLGSIATPISKNETAGELHDRLAELGAPLLLRVLEDVEAGRAQAIPQNPALATLTGLVAKGDGAIDWDASAETIVRHIRASTPWPGAFTFWKSGEEALRLVVTAARVLETPKESPGGTVLSRSRESLCIAAADGAVEIQALQPAGKRIQSAAEFLRGYALRPGDRLSPSA